jgi:phosphatidylglycerol:prolipoprotein diacylglycerol transferase
LFKTASPSEALIPYYQPPTLHLGPFTLESFGVFAAVGIYLAVRVAAGRAAREKLDPTPIIDYALWGVLAGVVAGHLVHLLLYHPEELRADPIRLFKVWDGLSSFGGLLGGMLAALFFFRWKGVRLLAYGDALALGIAPGWALARLGCFSVHDHKGIRTDFFLAVNFPSGPRHDLGLYDALLLLAIAVLLYALARRRILAGRLLAVLALAYGLGRFFLDFLRARDLPYVDARYLGLTPAQYACFLLLAWACWQLFASKRPASSFPGSDARPYTA